MHSKLRVCGRSLWFRIARAASGVALASAFALTAGCGDNDTPADPTPETPDASVPDSPDATPPAEVVEWPTIESKIPKDPEIEEAVADLVAQMSVEQKVGQMVQAEILDGGGLSPADVKAYHLGSVLNGGGSWPAGEKSSTVADWVALADEYYNASMDTTGGEEGEFLAIPILWGTDAVHGHSNVMGATLFPHNIGLGAANDPDLVAKIGAATAKAVAATGIDWTFAPTLAVVRDDRWGRTYEGYSEDPEIVRAYAGRMVEGIQGDPTAADELFSDSRVIATAKHFIGDGGTQYGKDQGDNLSTEQELLDIHAQGYLTALAAGAQTVMASFNSWQGNKLHGSEYMLTDVLRGHFQFDGFVIGDWNGHGQVPGCSNASCAEAIMAGVDMIMVPNDWKAFIENTVAQVNDGTIPMERIDEAVTRILRVKMRSGLLGPKTTKGAPSTRAFAGDDTVLGSDEHRALAREAVRKSQVLLKNKGGLLPLAKSSRVLLAGKTADNITNQSGGWTLTWQGTGNDPSDFPQAQSIADGVTALLTDADEGGTTTLSADGSGANDDDFDVAIVVIGETPYAEGQGDIARSSTLEHAVHYPEDLAVIEAVRANAPNLPIVTVLVSGRPLYVNKELNRSDAFVAAWLPGSEGIGVADVLFGDAPFTGKLSYSWPASDCQTNINRGDEGTPLFPYGFGLSTDDTDSLGDDLPEQSSEGGCDSPPPPMGSTDQPIDIFTGGADRGTFQLRIGGPSNWSGVPVSEALPGGEVVVTTIDGTIQGSAKQAVWSDVGQLYSQYTPSEPGVDLGVYANSRTSLTFRLKVSEVNVSTAILAVDCVYPCRGEIPFLSSLEAIADDEWHDVQVPLQCFINAGLDVRAVNTPFLLYAEGDMTLAIEDIRWQPNTADAEPDCSVYTAPPAEKDIIDEPLFALYTDDIAAGLSFAAYNNDPSQQEDQGGGDMAWVGNLVPGTNIAIHKDGNAADMSAYNVAGAELAFDLQVTNYENDLVDVLVKVATDFPNLGDLRLFSEVIGSRPTVGEWVAVSVDAPALIASGNDLAEGNVDITNVRDLLVLESVDGAIDVLVDNIRWTRPSN
ncbi:MAG: exo 1,3/1,4-beta-D-glucan glucohydrolase [Haliangiales bacterium]